MQDSWAAYASQHLGQRFERGRPKAQTRSEHLSPEDYKRSLELAADRERPWRELVGRIVAVFDGGKDKGNEREMVEWLHGQRERRLGKPRDSDRIAADLDLLTDGKLPEHELQFASARVRHAPLRRAAPRVAGSAAPPGSLDKTLTTVATGEGS